MDKEFILTILALDELKGLGYKEVWIGQAENPHSPFRSYSSIIAAPKVEDRCGWPALWRVSEQNFGKLHCGNGLKDADQAQISNVNRLMPGHYEILGEKWQKREKQ